jgi:integrase
MLASLRRLAPPEFLGPVLLDGRGLPRYWAAVWAFFQAGDLATSTMAKKLTHLESFYQHADQVLAPSCLDDALADSDVDALSNALEGYFLLLRDRFCITATSEERWQLALQFVLEVEQRITRNPSEPQQLSELHGRFMQLELLHAKLHVGRRRRPEQVRSLPADIIEFLYELLDPDSRANPFRGSASRWRVYVLFILMLHQGLRRGEALVLPTDVIKSTFDGTLQQDRFWMTVKYNEYEDDPRYSKAAIKNASSIRQLPVSNTIAFIIQEYAANHRGKAPHSFLFSSQKDGPLTTEAVTKIFQKITASIPSKLRRLLHDRNGKDSFSPHDLRHTCAVVRLNQCLSQGLVMEDALQRMRVFFGWSRNSDMPLRYARAVFEDRMASVWRDEFDDRVSILRSLPGSMK